ncbi:MAG: hypothetical protein LBG62_05650 [Candidatus Methanoplasma sp.]|nr:hypothetical protein [Candidatus Methanoplasma sp.]
MGLVAVFLSLALSLSEFGMGLQALFVAYVASMCAVAFAVGARWKRRGGSRTAWKKSRLAAMLMAWAPGMGHAYLDRLGEGVKFLVAAAISSAVTLAAVPLHEPDLALYGLFMLIFSATWSCIDVNRICDEMDLPYTKSVLGAGMEMHFKRSDVLEVLLFACMGLTMFGVGHVIITDLMTEPLPDKAYIALFDCVAPLFPIAIAAKYAAIHLAKRRKGAGK